MYFIGMESTEKQQHPIPEDISAAYPETEKTNPKGDLLPEVDEGIADADPLAVLQAENAELRRKNADLFDQVLRKAADFDNYRKRMIREKQDALDYANENLLSDLVDSLDNLDRALEAASAAPDTKTVADGVEMIKKQLVSMLEEKYHLSSYGEKGDIFDPHAYQGINSVQAPVAEPVCSEVYLKGYKLKDRVIRHAKVRVSMPDGSIIKQEEGQANE